MKMYCITFEKKTAQKAKVRVCFHSIDQQSSVRAKGQPEPEGIVYIYVCIYICIYVYYIYIYI